MRSVRTEADKFSGSTQQDVVMNYRNVHIHPVMVLVLNLLGPALLWQCKDGRPPLMVRRRFLGLPISAAGSGFAVW